MADHDTHDHTGIPGCSASSDLDAIIAASAGQDIADALAGAAAPDAGNVFATMADVGGGGGGGLVLLASLVASTSASLDLTTRNAAGQSGNLFQSDYDTYLFVMQNIQPATDGALALFRLSQNAGSTWDTSSVYSWTLNNQLFTSTISAQGGLSSAWQSFNDTANGGIANNGDPALVGSFRIFDPLNAAKVLAIGDFVQVYYANDNYYSGHWAAYYSGSVGSNALQFLFSSGNITKGKILVYGEAK